VTGPAGVMALVLAETAAGGAAFLFFTPLWGEVRRGFFYLTGSVVLVLSLAAAAAAGAGYDPAVSSEGRLAATLALVVAALTLAWLILMVLRLRAAGRILGIASVPAAVWMLYAFARTTGQAAPVPFFQLLAGAAFTGAVVDGLLLGHWYLTDRKLPRGPINRMAWALIGAVALEAIAVGVGGFGETRPDSAGLAGLNPLLTLAGTASWIALGMVACTGLIAVLIRMTLRGSRPTAVQSATGFFYLAVLTAFAAELAAKVRFLP
jgi:hypothetical protein